MTTTATHRPATQRRRFRHDDLVAVGLGCGVVSWEPYGEEPVRAGISRGGLLIPTGWAEP